MPPQPPQLVPERAGSPPTSEDVGRTGRWAPGAGPARSSHSPHSPRWALPPAAPPPRRQPPGMTRAHPHPRSGGGQRAGGARAVAAPRGERQSGPPKRHPRAEAVQGLCRVAVRRVRFHLWTCSGTPEWGPTPRMRPRAVRPTHPGQTPTPRTAPTRLLGTAPESQAKGQDGCWRGGAGGSGDLGGAGAFQGERFTNREAVSVESEAAGCPATSPAATDGARWWRTESPLPACREVWGRQEVLFPRPCPGTYL